MTFIFNSQVRLSPLIIAQTALHLLLLQLNRAALSHNNCSVTMTTVLGSNAAAMYNSQFNTPSFSPRNFQNTAPQFGQQELSDSLTNPQTGKHLTDRPAQT